MARRRRARTIALGATLLLGGGLAACSGSDDGPRTTTSRSTSSADRTTSTARSTTEPAAASLVDAACDGNLTAQRGPVVGDVEVNEASGVVVGRVQTSVAWVQNDSGGKPRLYGIRPDGTVQRVDVSGAETVDWEDLAPGGTTGDPRIWIADTGGNIAPRPTVQLYLVPEPGPSDASVAAQRIDVTYPDGPHDVEALLSDPDGGELYLLTKTVGTSSTLYSVDPQVGLDQGKVTAERVGSFAAPGSLALITGGDIAADRGAVVLRTYSGVWLYHLGPRQSVIEALGTKPCRGKASPELQGEAVGFAPDGRSYVTIAESAATKQPARLTTVTAG